MQFVYRPPLCGWRNLCPSSNLSRSPPRRVEFSCLLPTPNMPESGVVRLKHGTKREKLHILKSLAGNLLGDSHAKTSLPKFHLPL